jgi:hypothetical protein
MTTSDTSESSPEQEAQETFDEFPISFAYGSRNDLLFKWMKAGS